MLVVAVVLLATLPVRAEWLLVAKSDAESFYVDPSTIEIDGDLRRAWEITDLMQRHPDGWISAKTRKEYDCRNKRFRMTALTLYLNPMATGKVLFAGTRLTPWTLEPSGSVAEQMARLVCSASRRTVTGRNASPAVGA